MMSTFGGMAAEPKKVKTITRHPSDARWGDAEPYGSMLDQPVEVRAQATRMRSDAGPMARARSTSLVG
jgi:hypothetical protein